MKWKNRLIRHLLTLAVVCMTMSGTMSEAFAFNITGGIGVSRKAIGNEVVLTVTASDQLTVWGDGEVEVLLVGGGGGGGTNTTSDTWSGIGGGGGGGVVHKASLFVTADSYPVVIGSGGLVSANGGDTSAFGLVAYGGGAGANAGGSRGKDGASGGGATCWFNASPQSGGVALYADKDVSGHDGALSSHPYSPGGGGGAGAAALSVTSGEGEGGAGLPFSISGVETYYGGGGAGGRKNGTASGGVGGGGASWRDGAFCPGTDGLGGGGGGGAVGGSGVVVVRFRPTDSDDFSLSGGDGLQALSDRESLVFAETGDLTVTGSGWVEMMLVGGGGGGGLNSSSDTQIGGGGGGAGGVILTNLYLSAAESPYRITIGAGGAVGASGGDTIAFGLTAHGGGAGGRSSGYAGGDGASGGGGTKGWSADARDAGKALYGSEQNLGFPGCSATSPYTAGGGGGAGEAASANPYGGPGIGGQGVLSDLSGTWRYYAGGGTGYNGNVADCFFGGLGGGGTAYLNAVPGLGGGGCGGQAGGSGTVVLRYRRKRTYKERIWAEGGLSKRVGTDRVHVFTEDGAFQMPFNGCVEVLLVGGGGGGGLTHATDYKYNNAGGGGGGGVVHVTNVYLSAGRTYAIRVGEGGLVGENGGDSSAFGLTAFGGGGGASYLGGCGRDGASGGGGTFGLANGTSGRKHPFSGGRSSSNLGHAGASAQTQYAGGGGGGAGADAPQVADNPGAGGDGIACSITGEVVYYGGGGAASKYNYASSEGGKGGGGASYDTAKNAYCPGVDGLGGGGGGGAHGGSGIVVIRYAESKRGLSLFVR